MLFLLREKLLHLAYNDLKILGVFLFFMENYCIHVMKLNPSFDFFVYLIDEIVTRKNL